jgi:hypothetical protein
MRGNKERFPKKGEAQTFLGKRGNMECMRGKVRKIFK